MKVKIEKDGKKKTYNLINTWSDVTLEKWLQLIALEGLSPSQEAIESIYALSNIPKKIIRQLSISDVARVMQQIKNIEKQTKTNFKHIVKIDGVEYGFHPNLEDITLGEWADIETFVQKGINKSLPEIMAILYREITEKEQNIYTIKAYNGNINIRAEKFKKMKAEQVQGAMVFFWTFVSVLSTTLLSYLNENIAKMTTSKQEKHLQTNGDILV
tara:strand:+ start:137 stop:778 length:642 start_codon:yes stop_codon:yes gene_type:complete